MDSYGNRNKSKGSSVVIGKAGNRGLYIFFYRVIGLKISLCLKPLHRSRLSLDDDLRALLDAKICHPSENKVVL